MFESFLPSSEHFLAYSAYFLYIVIAAALAIPGPRVKGHPNPKRGPQLTYKIIGFRLTLLTVISFILLGGLIPQLKSIQLFEASYFANNFWQLFIVVNICAFVISALLYLKGRFNISLMGEQVDAHSHGSFALDFWVGRQLNPRIGSYDIKFNAYRVGMLFWLVLNLSFLAKQIETYGHTTFRMMGYQLIAGFYILDYFWFEQRMLTTWDIINEEFGYMLVFGDYVFIPFTFNIQCHFLVEMPEYNHVIFWFVIQILLFALGYYIFRTANSQKNQFKMNPKALINGKEPEVFQGKLLVSGFWGLGRHMNYTGDLIMAIAYCIPCGISYGIKPYFYFIYLSVLLFHRAYRDDAKCQQKYGKIWTRYCKRVPYVFVPFKFDYYLQSAGKFLFGITNPESKNTKERIQ